MKTLFKAIPIFLFLFAIGLLSAAQSLVSKVLFAPGGSVRVYAIVQSYDRNFLIVGSINDHALVMKLDSSGAVLWSRKIGGFYSSYKAVTATRDSCFLLAGSVQNPVSDKEDILCVKVNSLGDTLWTRTIAMDEAARCNSIRQTLDNGFIIAGGSFDAKVVIAKIDENGSFLWGKSYTGGNLANNAADIKQTPDSGYIVTGYMENSPVIDMGMFLMKLNSTGDVSWARHCIPTGDDYSFGESTEIVPGGYITCFLAANSDVAMTKTDTAGNVIWCKHYPAQVEVNSGMTMKMKMSSDGGLLAIFGNYFSNSGFLKFAADGNLAWSQSLVLIATDVVETGPDRFLVIGNGPIYGVKNRQNPTLTGAFVQTDSLGNGTCSELLGTSTENYQINFAPVMFSSEPAGAVSYISMPVADVVFEPYSGCVDKLSSVDEQTARSAHIAVYPNPSEGVFQVKIDGEGSGDLKCVEVYNMLGAKIYTSQVSAASYSKMVDISGFPAGIYQINAVLAGGTCSLKVALTH
jgi:hypothetical protein